MATFTFYGQTATVPDLSCSAVKPVATSILNWAGWSAISCSSDPVNVGTNINFVYAYVSNTTWQSAVTAVVDNPTTTLGGTTAATTCTPEPFDYPYAAQVWATAFSVTVGLYLIAFKVGTILKLFKRF